MERSKGPSAHLPLPVWEFVGIVASMMALNALAIDIMLPALSDIADHYQLSRANDQQWVIFAYVFGFGLPQLFFGPLSDRYGRRGLLQLCITGYIFAGLFCMMTRSFEVLLAMRFLQGVFAAGVRVIASAIVRDLMAGRDMARIMSLIMTVFMAVPILAPTLGAIVLLVAPWQWTFGILSVGGVLLLTWVSLRLPETQPAASRQPLSLRQTGRAYAQVLTTRETVGYMSASGVIFGALFAFIAASEQIFRDVFDRGDSFAIWFAGIAASLALANFVNSRIVERFGMRRISHIVLIGFTGLALTNSLILLVLGERLVLFYPLFCLTFACFGMLGSNFSAIALEPLGPIAGTASAAYGFATSTVASTFGYLVASRFDGSVVPILNGFVALGLVSLSLILITERGRLFASK